MSVPPEFIALYSGLLRQGPGLPEDVLWALERLGLSGPLRVCDAGAGSGADCATLARALPEAAVEGIEAMPEFVAAGQARLAGLPNATLRLGDMAALTGPYDLIWSAGAIYFLGVTEGLTAWRKALAPGGVVAFSQGALQGGDEPQAVRDFWAPEPGITTCDGVLAQVEAAGFEVIGTRLLTGAPWQAYYDSLSARIEALRPGASPAMAEVLAGSEREIALWKQAPDRIAYLLVLARPR
ncbi:methyltransferase domain-containing protein [Salipiger sp. P9]|uniref:class I SAM-dependent methyltransferase n=1 Tax=Salipiger pentaromativorans TaxID=2943193 RepID=UPI002156FB86|nr:class I SAM-dependent methyltransferase [Salipiger pentaromativorans]MCR8549751.1 methyltransferase domain-containing protein [Salipiger pentaromativorans]